MKSKQDFYLEIDDHLLNDKKPSEYFNCVRELPIFDEHPFTMLKKLIDTKQSPIHHPEGSVWNHTIMVLDEAAKRKGNSKDARVFMWAALLHDIGKPDTTKIRKGKITSYGHDEKGSELVKLFLKDFTDDHDFIDKVSALVRFHMQILFVVKKLPFADIVSMKKQTDIYEVALLGLCDRLGRLDVDIGREKETIEIFIDCCNRV